MLNGSNVQITRENAIQIALQQVPGQVIEAELEYENGVQVYDIDIKTPSGVFEVNVDAASGQIIKVEKDTD